MISFKVQVESIEQKEKHNKVTFRKQNGKEDYPGAVLGLGISDTDKNRVVLNCERETANKLEFGKTYVFRLGEEDKGE